MTTDPATAIQKIQAMQPDPSKAIYREQGYSDCKFSELALWLGYQEAKTITERIIGWGCCPDSCRLLTTYKDFLTALKEIEAQNTR